MKKILSLIILSILAVGLVAPVSFAVAADCANCVNDGSCVMPANCAQFVPGSCVVQIAVPGLDACKVGATISQGDEGFGMCCFIQTVNKITNWVFYVMTALAVLLFVYGGIVYMMALGEPEKAGKGSKIIVYAILGLIIALVAKIVPNIVTTLVR